MMGQAAQSPAGSGGRSALSPESQKIATVKRNNEMHGYQERNSSKKSKNEIAWNVGKPFTDIPSQSICRHDDERSDQDRYKTSLKEYGQFQLVPLKPA